MAIEYDLAILGATPEGLWAAEQAAQMGARVALISQALDGRRSPLQIQGLFHAMPGRYAAMPPPITLSPWQAAQQRATMVADNLTRADFQRLMVLGCDVIAETGQVLRDRPLTVATPSRQFTTRAVLLATGTLPTVPPVPGLSATPYDTPDSLLLRETLPQSVVILGGAPAGVLLAQLLRRWGVAVDLVTANAALLSSEDIDVRQWLIAQLRAEGVSLHLNTASVEVAAQAGAIALKTPLQTLTAEVLVLANAPTPHLSDLGLDAWIECDQPLQVNNFLQTPHPRIFACGSVLGGYDAPAIARQEAAIATHNALFWNRHRIDYCKLPYALPTEPEMARIGITEAQARQRFSSDELLIVRQPLYDHPQAQWRESTTGFCKLIAHRNGKILGLHGVGPEATEWAQAAAWLMALNTPWWRLAQYPALPQSLLALLQTTSQQWERDRWQPGQWRRNWAENWFNWRRSR